MKRRKAIAATLALVLLLTLFPTQTLGQGETTTVQQESGKGAAAPTNPTDTTNAADEPGVVQPTAPSGELKPEAATEPSVSSDLTRTDDQQLRSTDESQETEETEGGEEPEIQKIKGFAPLQKNIAQQKLFWGAKAGSVKLPTQLTATDQNGKSIVIKGITWKPDKPFNGKKRATYIYMPILPEGYSLQQGVARPKIKVTIIRRKTVVTGVACKRYNTAGKVLSDTITITPAYGRTIKLQRWNSNTKKWVTKATYKAGNYQKNKRTIRYPKAWYETGSSKWRFYMPATDGGTAYTSKTISVKAKRVYDNPSRYLQLQEKIIVKDSGGYNLRRGTMGLKVARVQRKLGMGRRWEIMDSATIDKVKAFQRRKGIKATGVVNLTTWKALGYSESSWYNLGKYIPKVKTNLTSTRKQCIEVMIETAKSYLGDEYIVGAAGKPGQGADCSGLVMQSLYAAGINPLPVSVVRHSQPGYEYESRNLWTHKKLKHVKYSQKKRGDLIFYKGRGGAIIHVAIYLGNGKVIESWPEKVCIWPIKNSHRSRIAGVVRPFV